MDSLLSHLERKERSRLRVVHVDIDERADLASRFKITTVPTIVLVKEKKVVARLEGRASAPKIDSLLETHLPPLEVEVAASAAA
jgi:thioredoxin-like negative regulator of GroEL